MRPRNNRSYSLDFNVGTSVTRFGDLLHFEQLFKACGNNHFDQILGNFCKVVKILHFSSEIFFGQLLSTFGHFLLVTLVGTQEAGLRLTSLPGMDEGM